MYTSTVNVTFGGKPIEQGDEDSVPYFPLDKVPISRRDGAGWQAWE